MNSSLFTLGTAQLGMEYGLTNKIGKPDMNQAFRLLDEAIKQGIRSFDTASGYGCSEDILGNYFKQNQGLTPEIVTKLKPLTINLQASDNKEIQQVDESINMSLERLRIDSIPILLFHRYENLVWRNCFLLDYLKNHAFVSMIGVSVSTPEQAISAIYMDGISAIQVPTNIFDFRYIKKGIFELAEQKGVRVYIRSIYLQGLILLDIKDIPSYLQDVKPVILQLKQFCADNNISSLKELTFSFLKSISGNNRIVIGCEAPEQIVENSKLLKSTKNMTQKVKSKLLETNIDLTEYILNPYYWRK